MQIDKFEGIYEFLSNKYKSTFYYKGVKYKSVAHAYFSLKLKRQVDAEKVRTCKTALEAIRLSKTFETRDDWQSNAKEIMSELLEKKFDNVFLKPKLLETMPHTLGDGRNFVGELLMELREKFKKKDENAK